MEEASVYSIIGEEGFTRLLAAFYREVPGDDPLGPMYPEQDREGGTPPSRFPDLSARRPQRYIEQRGHPRLRARHLPFRINQAARDRWMQLMDNAFSDAALPEEAERQLGPFFEQMSTFMINEQ